MPVKNANKLLIINNEANEIAQLLKKFPTLTKAIRANSALAIIIGELVKAAASMKVFSEKQFEQIIKTNKDLSIASKDPKFKAELFKLLKSVIEEKPIIIKTPTDTPTVPEDDADSDEEDDFTAIGPSLELLGYLNDIPIAHRGDIITSEHHNSLRKAIYALADGIGIGAGNAILTFAPNFQPVALNRGDNEGEWKVIFNKAVVPTVGEIGGAGGKVTGAFIVRLPDDFLIKGMIVRGKRIDEEADNPKAFNVSLFRVKMDSAAAKPSLLINFDLKEKDEFFQVTEAPKITNLRVNNAEYQYFVSAFWEDEDDSARFELYAVQIFCEP